jgi:hypothetical protein
LGLQIFFFGIESETCFTGVEIEFAGVDFTGVFGFSGERDFGVGTLAGEACFGGIGSDLETSVGF